MIRTTVNSNSIFTKTLELNNYIWVQRFLLACQQYIGLKVWKNSSLFTQNQGLAGTPHLFIPRYTFLRVTPTFLAPCKSTHATAPITNQNCFVFFWHKPLARFALHTRIELFQLRGIAWNRRRNSTHGLHQKQPYKKCNTIVYFLEFRLESGQNHRFGQKSKKERVLLLGKGGKK